MGLSYSGLWQMLSGLNINKMEFAKSIDISNATLAKLGKNEPVSLTVLMRICEQYKCKIENVVEYIPDNQETSPIITTLQVGTVLICTCYPMGTSIIQKHRSKILKRQPCVLLQTYFRDRYTPQLLVAPLSYASLPDTVFDVSFKNLELENETIEKGYIQIGKMGYVIQKNCESVLGRMPEPYMQEALILLEKIKPILNIKE